MTDLLSDVNLKTFDFQTVFLSQTRATDQKNARPSSLYVIFE